jgi:hypothetical protein
MADADVKSWIETTNPSTEIVTLHIGGSGSTYPSRKFDYIRNARVSSNSSSSGTLGVTFLGGTKVATIYHGGGSGSVTLVLWGN